MESMVSGCCQYSREGWEVVSDAPFAQKTSPRSAMAYFFSDNINGKTLLEMMEGTGGTVDVFDRSLHEPLGPLIQPIHPPNGLLPSIPMYVSGFADDLWDSLNVDGYEGGVLW